VAGGSAKGVLSDTIQSAGLTGGSDTRARRFDHPRAILLSDPLDNHDDGSSSRDHDATAFGASDRGRVRETNQDQFLIARLYKSMSVAATTLLLEPQLQGKVQGQVLLVADGMGGHAAGEKASRLAIGHLIRQLLDQVQWFLQSEENGGDEDRENRFMEGLRQLLRATHAQILDESARNATDRGMGTTLTMAHIVWPRLYVAHVGDSRCYLIRDAVAEQLTTDHTLARQMVESGGLKPEDEADSRWSNVLWNVLGGFTEGELVTEVRRVDLQVGDTIVLCSDGLHRYVDSDRLAEIVSATESPQEASQRLIEIANDAGGEDNITVVVARPQDNDDGLATQIDEFDTSIT
jgi:serine/threonine protein phosphatase PrpC